MTTNTARTFTITSPAPRHHRDQRPTVATHRLANELPGVAVGATCGRTFGFASTGGLTVDPEPRPVTCAACREGRQADVAVRAHRRAGAR